MFDSLKDHPFAVSAFFERSLVLSYALPADRLQRMLPPCLTPDLFEGDTGFVAAAMVRTKALRPKGFPTWLGNDFDLVGYRIFVNYMTSAGKRLRGLYILGSETNKKSMTILGNVFTHYHYKRCPMDFQSDGALLTVDAPSSGLHVKVDVSEGEVQLPAGSPFRNWQEARRFAGPLPFTFTFDDRRKEVLIIEGLREHWTPRPVKVLEHRIGFFDRLGLVDGRLANAFLVEDIPYAWKKGRRDPWKG